MEVLELDGKRYIKASKAAKAAGYTTDYVGQLCRAEKISAQLVGRSWYVHAEELQEYRGTSKRNARAKAREQLKVALEIEKVRKLSVTPEKHFEAYIPKAKPLYEEDDTSLIPEVRKLKVEHEVVKVSVAKHTQRKLKKKPVKEVEDTEPNYVIENAGDPVRLTGKLKIIDATDEFTMDPDSTVLSPQIIKGELPEITKSKEVLQHTRSKVPPSASRSTLSLKVFSDQTDEGVDVAIEKSSKPSFVDRLQGASTEASQNGEIAIENIDITDATTSIQYEDVVHHQTGSILAVAFMCVISVLLSAGILLIEGEWQYFADSAFEVVFESDYHLNAEIIFSQF